MKKFATFVLGLLFFTSVFAFDSDFLDYCQSKLDMNYWDCKKLQDNPEVISQQKPFSALGYEDPNDSLFNEPSMREKREWNKECQDSGISRFGCSNLEDELYSNDDW